MATIQGPLTLVRVQADRFVAGVEVDARGVIVIAAPILRWALYKPLTKLQAWCRGKGFKCDEYPRA